MDDQKYKVNFLPHVRLSFAAGSVNATKLITVKINGTPITEPKTINLLEPADIASISYSMIARVYPPPGTQDSKYDLFPFIEFKDADFLWRYSYCDTKKKELLPWLALVTLKKGQFEISEETLSINNPVTVKRLKLINCALNFENFSKYYLWGHVQLTGYFSTATTPADKEKELKALLRNDASEKALSRLICPIKLVENTAYSAFVIPLHELLKANNQSKLSVFYTWDFSTSSIPSFESLSNLIKNNNLEECHIQITGPEFIDFGKEPQDNDAITTFPMHGALMSEECIELDWGIKSKDLLTNFYRKYLDSSPTVGEDDNDPYVGYPIYGSYQGQVPLPPEMINTAVGANLQPWQYELNIRSTARIAAGLGAEIVRKNQEEFVDYLNRANEPKRADVAKIRKDIPDSREEVLKSEVANLLNKQITERMILGQKNKKRQHGLDEPISHQILRVYPAVNKNGLEEKDKKSWAMFEDTNILRGSLSYSCRKIMHQKIANSKKAIFNTDFNNYLDRRLSQPTKRSEYSVTHHSTMLDSKIVAPIYKIIENEVSKDRFVSRIENKQLKDVFTAEIPFPMYTYLAKQSLDYMLPHYGNVPNNSILFLSVNNSFLNSYMAGLNHEMMRELIWREYPVNFDKTIFKCFWDNANADISEINQWANNGRLGSSLGGIVSANSVVFLKADLIKFYPDIIMQVVTSAKEPPSGTKPEDWQKWIESANPQTILFRTPISDNAVAIGIGPSLKSLENGAQKLYFILKEHPSMPLFGLPKGIYSESVYIEQLNQAHFTTRQICNNDWFEDLLPNVVVKEMVSPSQEKSYLAPLKHSSIAAKCVLQRRNLIVIPFEKYRLGRRRPSVNE